MVILPGVIADLAAHEHVIVVAIVLARLLVPLLIPRVPLVIIAALILDAADNSLLDAFTDIDLGPDGPYQSFDKALDIYYLAIAYLAMMRNWTSDAAFRIGQCLFYYRLVGVLLFELLDARAMLLIFPNSFEYFFIAYELMRLRFEPSRWSARFWLLTAAAIWVFVKLPQEYWIHIAQRDFTDTVVDNPLVGAVCVLVVLALAAVILFVVRPRLPAPDWGWRLAAGPLPSSLGEAHVRHAQRLRTGRVLWGELAEKIALLALLSVIFASILSDVEMTALEIVVAAIVIVPANAAISMWYARSTWFGSESSAVRFGGLLAVNVVLVYLASRLLSDSEEFPLGEGLFFAFLVTLLVWLYDAYKPIYDVRFLASRLKVGSLGDFWRRVVEPAS